jgi:hypothetical protein
MAKGLDCFKKGVDVISQDCTTVQTSQYNWPICQKLDVVLFHAVNVDALPTLDRLCNSADMKSMDLI